MDKAYAIRDKGTGKWYVGHDAVFSDKNRKLYYHLRYARSARSGYYIKRKDLEIVEFDLKEVGPI